MKKPPRVLLDVDDVIADFVGYYLQVAGKVMNTDYLREQVTEWDIDKCLDLPEWAKREMKYLICQPRVASAIPEFPGAVESIKELSQISEIYFVTAPYRGSPTWTRDREDWLHTRFGELGKRVIHTSYKAPVSGDFFIDDRPINLLEWGDEQNGIPILWDRPHNRSFDNEASIIPRMNSWESVIKLVKEKV